jgi:hypothetical protein
MGKPRMAAAENTMVPCGRVRGPYRTIKTEVSGATSASNPIASGCRFASILRHIKIFYETAAPFFDIRN